MRIHQLTVENITSLRGGHHIDFDQLLSAEDIFAITGPTGSGKSSILSAIGLALYNTANKEGVGPLELISQGADYGKVILDFSTMGVHYRSIWECRLKQKNGVMLKSPKQLHLFYKEGEVTDTNGEQILGLSYDQFSKTVVLNQGQFAEFLTSRYTDRRNILEKLFDSEQLTKLGLLLNDKLKISRAQLASIEQAIEAIGPLSQVAPEALEKEANEAKTKLEEIKLADKSFQKFNQVSNDYLKLRRSIHEQHQKRRRIETEISLAIENGNTQKINRDHLQVQLQEKKDYLDKIRPTLLQAIEKHKELSSLGQKLNEMRSLYNKMDAQLQQRAPELTKQKAELHKLTEDLSCHIHEFPHLFAPEQMEAIKLKIHQLKRTIEISNTVSEGNRQFQRDLDRQNKIVESKNEQLNQLRLRFKDQFQEDFETQKVLQLVQASEDAVSKLQIKNRQFIAAEQNLITYRNVLEKQKVEIEKKSEAILLLKKKAQVKRHDLELIQKKIEIAQLESSKKQLEDAISRCRHESSKNGNCVVCHTPWSELPLFSQHNPVDETNSVSLEELQTQSAASQIEEANISNHLRHEEEQCKQLEIDHQDTMNKASELEADLKETTHAQLKEQLDKAINTKAQIPHFEQQIKQVQTELNTIFEDIKGIKIQLDKGLAELQRIEDDQKMAITEIRNALPHYPNTAQLILEQFDTDRSLIEKRKELSTAVNNGERFVGQLEKEFAQAKKHKEEIEESGKEIGKQHEQLKKQIEADFNYSNPAAELENLTQAHQQTQLSFNSANELWLTTNKEIETKQSFINGIDEIIKAKELEKLQLEGTSLSCPAEYIEHPLFNGDVVKTFLHKKEQLFLQNDEEAQQSIELLIDGGIAPLLYQLNELKEEFSKTYHHLNGQRMIVLQNLERLNALHQERLQVKSSNDQLTLLNDVIGKQEFRDFALSIIERELIRSANIELKRICDGRYQLKQQQSGKHKYEFFVIDHFSGAQERKVNTLSGGETFLVSLAMAMALSEMTRGKTEIDSFFIDEGFGSLDEDSLNDALDTLLQIRNRGKRIGIISHVQGLTERIPVNIRLTKSELGESSLSFIQQLP